jgi:hypothetical protein
MHITFKNFFTAFASLIIPGLGQIFHGKLLWASFWFFAAVVLTPMIAPVAALHCFLLD